MFTDDYLHINRILKICFFFYMASSFLHSLEKIASFWKFFDSQTAIFRRVRFTPGETYFSHRSQHGWQIWHPNWVRLAPNGTNLGLFKISFSTFWLGEPKCTETDLKISLQFGREIWHDWCICEIDWVTQVAGLVPCLFYVPLFIYDHRQVWWSIENVLKSNSLFPLCRKRDCK